jgi:predicted dehydrogenase
MHQVVQSVRDGSTQVRKIPDPIATPASILIASVASLISAGTERSVVELARKSLVGKALDRPDHVRRVIQKVREEGLFATFDQVRARLDEPMPLGYSSAGIVLECGKGVQGFKPGDRVASAGPHAGVVCVGHNLCARIPDGVSFEQAAYTSVAAIALEGVRLARVSLGERVLVIGLGLIGQISVCLLKAQGCRVLATDLDPSKVELARKLGADETMTGADLERTRAFSESAGVDAVLICASTPSNDPIEFAAEVCRTRGRIVLIGVVGLNLPRPPFFKKELEFTVSSSLGPGRGDPVYEDKGVDYPFGQVRWTAQRNMAAVLELMAQGKLPVEKLTTHRFPIEKALDAYTLITEAKEPQIGVLLQYEPIAGPLRRRVELRSAPESSNLGISVIGAGNFARLIMLPALAKSPAIALRGLCSAHGLNAQHTGNKHDFTFAATDPQEVFNDAATKVVFIATRHDLHASLVLAALKAGKHVFVEKPLCITAEELAEIEACIQGLGDRCPLLMVGFNRRFAPATTQLKGFFNGINPLSVSYRFSPGALPPDHWTQDEEVGGGRIVGEACHAIDFCVSVTGSPPVRVFAESVAKVDGLQTSDDRVFITLRHANGSVSNISYQAGGDRGAPPERAELFGGGRTATMEGWDELQLWQGGRAKKISGGKDKGHRAEFKAFLEACRAGGSWPISWDHLYGTTWASLMAVRSLREGTPFDLPPTAP